MKKLILLIAALTAIVQGTSFAQNQTENAPAPDSTVIEFYIDTTYVDDSTGFFENYPMPDSWADAQVIKKNAPFIAFEFGTSKYSLDKDYFKGSFGENGGLEVKIGFKDLKYFGESGKILEIEDEYAYFSKYDKEMSRNKPTDDRIKTNTWGFGFGQKTGLAYAPYEGGTISLYNTKSSGWSFVNFDNLNSPATALDSASILYAERIADGVRFGESFSAGLELTPYEMVSVYAEYKRDAIYPRFVFWYWTLNKLIDGAGGLMIDEFVSKVEKSRPYAAPIMGFLLKTAFNYGMYELMKTNMHWPTNTEPALINEQFKIGLSVNF